MYLDYYKAYYFYMISQCSKLRMPTFKAIKIPGAKTILKGVFIKRNPLRKQICIYKEREEKLVSYQQKVHLNVSNPCNL